jgi:hypothetical protein
MSKELWPTEKALAREGLVFEKNGRHDSDWPKVVETLKKMKQNPGKDMSAVDMTKRCRILNSLLQVIWQHLLDSRE